MLSHAAHSSARILETGERVSLLGLGFTVLPERLDHADHAPLGFRRRVALRAIAGEAFPDRILIAKRVRGESLGDHHRS